MRVSRRLRGHTVKGIYWLASYPKSGNTWLRIFMENLFRNTTDPASISDLAVVKYADTVHGLYEAAGGRSRSELSDAEIHRLRGSVQRRLASQDETSFVKTHNMLARHLGLPLIYPQYTVGATYLVRNPFDMVVSYAHHYGIGLDDAIASICSPYNRVKTSEQSVFQILGSWSQHVQSWTSSASFRPLVLRYEDMINRPVRTFEKFVATLGLPRNPERLRRAVRHSGFATVAAQERERGFRERARADQVFFRSGSVGSWRDILNEHQAGRIIDAHGEVLIAHRYMSPERHASRVAGISHNAHCDSGETRRRRSSMATCPQSPNASYPGRA